MTFYFKLNKSVHLPDVSPKHRGKVKVMLHQRKDPVTGKISLVKQHEREVDKNDETSEYSSIISKQKEYAKKLEEQNKDTTGLKVDSNDMGHYFNFDYATNSFTAEDNSKWETNTEFPLKSTYEGKSIKKFALSYKNKRLILVTPTGKEAHAQALGIGNSVNDASIESFDDFVRGFYDPKNNAVGLRTPYVEGLKENGMQWNDELRAKTFDVQYKIADFLFRHDPTLKVVINIGNRDVGREEVFRYDKYGQESRTITKE